MDPQALNHIALRASLAGALKVPVKDGPATPDQAAQCVWEWAQASFPIDPHRPLTDGLPAGASLAADPEVPFCPAFLKRWMDEYGQESLFPPSSPTLAERWALLLVDALKNNYSHRATAAAQRLAWFMEHGPNDQLPIPLARQSLELIEANRKSNLPLEPGLAEKLAVGMTQVLGDTFDPHRSPLRWSATIEDLQEGVDLSMPVRAPSGRIRPLEEWVRLRTALYSLPKEASQSQSTIPRPPNRQRLFLARDWVLDPDASLDEARARLWSATRENPAAVWTLLEWADNPPKRSPHYPDRITDILAARDAHGRSYLAFLTSSRAGAAEECEAIARHVIEKGWVPASAVYATNGSGLVEQAFVSQRLGHRNDAFEYAIGKPCQWVIDLWGEEVYRGPPERQQALEEDLVDWCLPGGGRLDTRTLLEVFPSEKIRQALLWKWLNQNLNKGLETHNMRRTQVGEAIARAVSRVEEKVEELVTSIEAHPGILWIGNTEFSQLKSMIYVGALEGGSLNASEFRETAKRGVERLERAVALNDMHLHMNPLAPAAPRAHRL